MIAVLATIELADDRREDFLQEFRRIVPKVQAEQGCLEYQPYLDVPTSIGGQPPSRENVVVVLEKWESVAALESHLMTPHMQEYRKAVKEMVVQVGLQVLRPA